MDEEKRIQGVCGIEFLVLYHAAEPLYGHCATWRDSQTQIVASHLPSSF